MGEQRAGEEERAMENVIELDPISARIILEWAYSSSLTRFVIPKSPDQHTSTDGYCGWFGGRNEREKRLWWGENWKSFDVRSSIRRWCLAPSLESLLKRPKRFFFSPQSPSQVTSRVVHHNSWKLTTNNCENVVRPAMISVLRKVDTRRWRRMFFCRSSFCDKSSEVFCVERLSVFFLKFEV